VFAFQQEPNNAAKHQSQKDIEYMDCVVLRFHSRSLRGYGIQSDAVIFSGEGMDTGRHVLAPLQR